MSFGKRTKETVLTLNYGNALLEILPEIGGCITRYCLETNEQVLELLRPATQAGIASKDPLEMASFPLIPFSNRIRDGRFSFQGKEINLPPNFPPETHTIHGHGWKVPWVVTEVSPNKATIEYRYIPDGWPFPYLASQIFELTDSALTVNLQIINTGNSVMPVGFGMHPYFVRTPEVSVTTKIEKMWINDSENMPLRLEPVQGVERLNQVFIVNQEAIDNLFTGWNRVALISWPEWKANLRISASIPLDFLVLFTPSGEDYFCVEPVSNVTDAFNLYARGDSGHGTKILFPGESVEGKVCFVPELDLV